MRFGKNYKDRFDKNYVIVCCCFDVLACFRSKLKCKHIMCTVQCTKDFILLLTFNLYTQLLSSTCGDCIICMYFVMLIIVQFFI